MTCDSYEDYEEVMYSEESLVSGMCVAGNAVISGEMLSGIGFESAEEYIVTKVEKKVEEEKPGLIFEGELALKAGELTTIPVTTYMSPTRKYEIEVIINGEKVTTYAEMSAESMGYGFIVFVGSEATLMFGENIVILGTADETYEVTLTSIYDVGPSSTVVEENGFTALKSMDGSWVLCGTPEEEYIVPETVKGNVINKVNIEALKGIPTFTRPVVIYNPGNNARQRPTAMKVTTTDLSFVFEMPGKDTWFNLEYMDFSECGDDIEFPEEFLSSGQYRWEDEYADGCAVVYVSSAVKAKYADYDFIQVKE